VKQLEKLEEIKTDLRLLLGEPAELLPLSSSSSHAPNIVNFSNTTLQMEMDQFMTSLAIFNINNDFETQLRSSWPPKLQKAILLHSVKQEEDEGKQKEAEK
jgi:hypothetical protein